MYYDVTIYFRPKVTKGDVNALINDYGDFDIGSLYDFYPRYGDDLGSFLSSDVNDIQFNVFGKSTPDDIRRSLEKSDKKNIISSITIKHIDN